MTAKRFVDYFDKDHNYIIQDLQNEDEYQVGFVNCDEDIFLELINHLNDENEHLKEAREYYQENFLTMKTERNQFKRENEQLKNEVFDWKASAEDYLKLGKSLKKENEQLKQFKEDVFNQIDMHLRMLPTARDNEFNDDDGDPSLYVGAIYMLETLKKELEE